MRRRLLAGTTAFVALTGVVLVLPVYSEPAPEAVPVETSVAAVAMGSFTAPAPEAQVQEGTTAPVAGVPDTVPTLSVRATEVAEFSLVGVTWALDPAVTDTIVQVRVRDLAGNWGTWTEVEAEGVEQAADAETGSPVRGGTAPLWTGPATAVEAELVTRAGAQPTDVQLDLVDPGDSAADGSLGTPDITETADAAVAMPPVFSRAQWGADEKMMSWTPQYASTIKAATLHHTAGSNDYTADQVPAILRSTYAYHAKSLGWGDIGYNVLVDKFGRLWEGRAGGLSSTVVGAHAGGFNTSTFGVSMMGNYDVVDTPQAMVDSVAAIIAWKFSLYGVDPRGTTTLTSGGTDKFAAGARATLPTVFAHRDTKYTACPGKYGYARMGEIRDKVAARMADTKSPIATRYDSDAGLRAWLGAPVGDEQSEAGVTWQVYTNGARLYSSPTGGVRLVLGGILDRYLAAGGPAVLGPPITDDAPTPGGRGAFVRFQHGDVYWSPETGSQLVRGNILAAWLAAGGATGGLGFPTTSDALTPGGGGYVVRFQGGDIYWSQATGARTVLGSIRDTWLAAGGPTGFLGFPTTSDTPAGKGAYVRFQGGEVLWSPTTGTHIVRGNILDAYRTAGGPTGGLGFPTTSDAPTPDGRGYFVRFQGGDIYWSPTTGARIVMGSIRDTWLATGGSGGYLGFPTTSDTPAGKGAFVRFQGGEVLWSPTTGTRIVRGNILDAYRSAGGPTGFLGYPTTSDAATKDGRGYFVRFQGGDIYWSAATGPRIVRGSILTTWLATGGATGPLGFPMTSDTPVPGKGAYVRFQSGDVYWSPTTGTQVVRGSILSTWLAAGGATGSLGFPTISDAKTADGRGYVVRFTGGDVYWSPATGAQVVSGAMAKTYWQRGGSSSALGFPTRSSYAIAGGLRTDFERGSMTWNATSGAVAVSQ
ncbi:N-acetylmuramoyl-L-alanine amidase [Geodermatophilus chilensis]|uniref:N-acetylmuramoyl-L-alanine amidase n=1 Tax=Geodermatophilus chilensis TaxID=2035835 RepID=UPI000C261CFF|nr:N-acetylmuramoyl-L-alanine amidase [Geodermatophilus chilensis]